ncbi:MAG TPA: preprotein translocase subunit SecE [Dehalococcoidia bacterium]|nr:preprotein translocase subunit SecE [Dehalococcoidia bacterium]
MPAAAHHSATAKRSRLRFIGETITELKKVVWLSRREVLYLSTLVLIISVIAGLILGAIDYGFSALVGDVFLGR